MSRPIAVDRTANVIRGMVVAQAGPFKDYRGEFTNDSLQQIVKLGNATGSLGLKSLFGHASETNSGLGNFLGRVKDFFMSSVKKKSGVTIPAVRADLHLDKTALDTPPRGGRALGQYLMSLAESDPDAVSSSLSLFSLKQTRRDKNGDTMVDSYGNPLPPIWMPMEIYNSDVVDNGAAVDGILSAEPSMSEEIEVRRRRAAGRIDKDELELRRRRLRSHDRLKSIDPEVDPRRRPNRDVQLRSGKPEERDSISTSNSLETTAIHEAAHAVLTIEQGGKVIEATIVPQGGNYGSVSWYRELLSPFETAIVYFGGFHAENLFDSDPRHVANGHCIDFSDVKLTGIDLADRNRAFERSKRLVLQREMEIRAVAEALLKHKTLSNFDIVRVMTTCRDR